MAKLFAPRVSKKERKTIDLSDKLDRDLFRISESKLMQGAQQEVVNLKDIAVKEQVRTKFNDQSLKDLAQNIKENGLIQPLVIHREGMRLTLICGERRYRAMMINNMTEAPCFVLDNKTTEELMAIQFSENSSREELHYIDKADGILNYQLATNASERKIQASLGISKSEVHRSLLIAKMSDKLKDAGKMHDIEKYVLLEFDEMPSSPIKKKIEGLILSGKVTKRSQLKKYIKEGGQTIEPLQKITPSRTAQTPSTAELIQLLSEKSKDEKLDKKTKELLADLL